MRYRFRVSTVLGFVLLTAACQMAPSYPTTPQQLRAQGSIEDSYTVNRPYRKAVAGIAKGARKCLYARVKTTIEYGPHWYTHYTPSLGVGRNHSELRLQELDTDRHNHIVGKVKFYVHDLPKNGWYILVADIKPTGSGATNLTVYRDKTEKNVSKAIRNWAQGSFMGCPDLGGVE